MSTQITEILEKIKDVKYENYTEFKLSSLINMNSDEMQKLVFDLNNKQNVTATYNKYTYQCDIVGVYDDKNNNRWIDFDDDQWTMENKGLQAYTTRTKYK